MARNKVDMVARCMIMMTIKMCQVEKVKSLVIRNMSPTKRNTNHVERGKAYSYKILASNSS
jgi:hypothetical protein